MYVSPSLLSRIEAQEPLETAFSEPATLAPFYTALDTAYAYLITVAQLIASLPPTPDGHPLSTAWRAFDLFGLVNSFRRSLLRLDLLLHQRVIECLLASQSPPPPPTPAVPAPKGSSKGKAGAGRGKNAAAQASSEPPPSSTPPPPPQAPSSEMLQSYSLSRHRVQRCFALAAELARHAVDTSSLLFARQLVETLEVCTTWTQLRTAEKGTAAELLHELGITVDMGQTCVAFLSPFPVFLLLILLLHLFPRDHIVVPFSHTPLIIRPFLALR
jgi:hypothetical protein